jgi:hypothetical protein
MARTFSYVGIALMMMSFTTVSAQKRPDFTGTWMMDTGRSESAAQPQETTRRTPERIVIVDALDHLSIAVDVNGRTELTTYDFDKPEAPRPVGTSGGNDVTIEASKAEWRDNHLITTTVYKVDGVAMKKIESRTLAPGGREMTVETVTKVERFDGVDRDTGAHTIVKDVYTR